MGIITKAQVKFLFNKLLETPEAVTELSKYEIAETIKYAKEKLLAGFDNKNKVLLANPGMKASEIQSTDIEEAKKVLAIINDHLQKSKMKNMVPISEYLNSVENILASIYFGREPDVEDIAIVTLHTKDFTNELRHIYLSGISQAEKDAKYKYVYEIISKANYHIQKENVGNSDQWNVIINSIDIACSHVTELHFKESNQHYPSTQFDRYTEPEQSKPKQKNNTKLFLFDIWLPDSTGAKKRQCNKYIEYLKQDYSEIGSPFITEINGGLQWNNTPQKGWVQYLAGFIYTCLKKKWIHDTYSAPDYKAILERTFNIEFNLKPFKHLTSAPPKQKYLEPFKGLPVNI